MILKKGWLIILFISCFSNSFELKLPMGFPEPYIPEETPLTTEGVNLGKKLFFDTMLSRDSSISCASCHIPSFAFTDRKTKSIGIHQQQVSRNSPTLTNVVYQDKFLLDGLNPSLEAQVKVPIHEKNEFDFHIVLIAERMKKNAEYVRLSKLAYKSEPTPAVISKAIASYQRTLISGDSPYDKFENQGKEEALNTSEKRGMNIFKDKLYCTECHSGFNFTNGSLTNNGLYEVYSDRGRMRSTEDKKDEAIFKVPTLRNIAITHPYMHDGSLKSLEQVIDHYAKGGKSHINKSPIIKAFKISDSEKQDLVNFLTALTDSSFIQNHSTD